MSDFDAAINNLIGQINSQTLMLQLLAIALTVAVSWLLARFLRGRLDILGPPEDEANEPDLRHRVGNAAYQVRDLLFPAICAAMLGLAVAVSAEFFDRKWLIQLVQGGNFLGLVYLFATRLTQSASVKVFSLCVLVPIAVLYAVGLLDNMISILESVQFELGSIKFSLYSLARTAVFGVILFWLGSLSSVTGRDLIKKSQTLDRTAQELVLKSFQILLFVGIVLILLQVAGIDLTALVVVGGALGVGLGFGLQQIAANFISGIIILIDRSIAIGDFIELEDGRAGQLRELSMRSATLETYDGKDIMVPNERFITTAFTNWTHNNQKQRYPILFEVPYGTDLEELFPVLRDVVASHPQVLSGDKIPIEERPDAEISKFAESGIEILIEFWMEGVDDGQNRVGADLLLMIWNTLRERGIDIPFPQREVRLLNEKP